MLVSFSCFCGFVCCKLQYINPCPLPESLSCFRQQVLQLHPRWDKLSVQPCPLASHPKPRCPAGTAPKPPCLPVPGEVRPLAGAIPEFLGPSRGSCPHLWGSISAPGRLQSSLGPGHQGAELSGSAGLGGSSAVMSPRLRSAFKATGAVVANQPVGGSGESPAGTAGIIGGSS